MNVSKKIMNVRRLLTKAALNFIMQTYEENVVFGTTT